MHKPAFVSLILLLMFSACKPAQQLQTVPSVDLEKFAGTWYEISAFPIGPEKNCRCVTATYGTTDKGYVTVLNRCVRNGKETSIEGKAFVKDSQTNSKLAVQFFWPFRGKYWIIELDENYQYAVIGHPNRNYLWILNRSPKIDPVLYADLVQRAKAKGFDVERIRWMPQDCE
ncbi:MAG: lipocalin family protein [Saprospirales bacterium]|nr:lipocalin family protein [Saprospirales bacterium]